jgi:predicted nucleic acid-binding Zn ribbon protein
MPPELPPLNGRLFFEGGIMLSRELTRWERKEIRRLVTKKCANYDKDYGCLPLDYGRCYMLDKWWTGAYCKYFTEAVLPLNPALEAALTGNPDEKAQKICLVCGAAFHPATSQTCCSEKCRAAARREQNRINQKNRREKKGDLSST